MNGDRVIEDANTADINEKSFTIKNVRWQVNEFILLCSSEKDFLFDCLHLNELVLFFGEQKQRGAFQFNGH